MYAADAASGTNALSTSAAGIARYVPAAQKVCYALAAIIAIVSAAVIYKKLNDGAEDAKKLIALPVLACVFLTASATALPKFFGLDVTQEDGGWSSGGFDSSWSGGGSDADDATPEPAPEPKPNVNKNAIGVGKNLIDGYMLYNGQYVTYTTAEDGTKIGQNLDLPGTGFTPGYIGKSPDGTFKYYAIADDGSIVWGNAVVPDLYSGSVFWRGVQRGTAPDGEFRYYLLSEEGEKVWGNKVIPSANTEDAKVGLAEDGTYKFYFENEQGDKIWGGNVTGLWRGEVEKDSDGVYKWMRTADDGTKIWGGAAVPQYGGDYEGVTLGDDGQYHYYVTANDGNKVLGTVCSPNYGNPVGGYTTDPSQPTFYGAKLGHAEDGTYKWYVIADDGSKCWGVTVPANTLNYNHPNVKIGLNPSNNKYCYFLDADDGSRLWGKPA